MKYGQKLVLDKTLEYRDPKQYMLGINWLNNWIDEYFFNKVSEFFTFNISVYDSFFTIFFWKKSYQNLIN